jgi:hypothetical protein
VLLSCFAVISTYHTELCAAEAEQAVVAMGVQRGHGQMPQPARHRYALQPPLPQHASSGLPACAVMPEICVNHAKKSRIDLEHTWPKKNTKKS